MGLKDNVSQIKDELTVEEQFFTNFFKIEKFYKKYKYIIFGTIFVVVAFFITNGIINYLSELNKIEANNAYSKFLANPKDTNSLNILKEKNAQLFAIAQFEVSKNKTQDIDVLYLKEIAQYNKAVEQNDIEALNKLIVNPNFLLKDFAKFNKALILTQKKEFKKAKATLDTISYNSPVASLANMLNHYLLTK